MFIKHSSLKLAMCFSLLVHGAALSLYFVSLHDSNTLQVRAEDQFVSQIEIVNDVIQKAPGITAPVTVKASEISDISPPPSQPPLEPEIIKTALDTASDQTSLIEKTSEIETVPLPVTTKIESSERSLTIARADSQILAPMGGDAENTANYLLNPKPVYPLTARKRKEQGLVVLAVQVDRAGFSNGIKIVQSSSFPLLDEAAVKAVNRWRFLPAQLGNVMVASHIEVPIRFKLTD